MFLRYICVILIAITVAEITAQVVTIGLIIKLIYLTISAGTTEMAVAAILAVVETIEMVAAVTLVVAAILEMAAVVTLAVAILAAVATTEIVVAVATALVAECKTETT